MKKEKVEKVCFNSLRTGKPIQSRRDSNRIMARLGVSIPYERESLSKGFGKITLPTNMVILVSIPYERESLSKADRAEVEAQRRAKFQFPTNGKAYPKKRRKKIFRWQLLICFNSLRTGKPIQS